MDDQPQALTDHLDELRSRLIKIIAAWLVCAGVAWTAREQIFGLVLQPALSALEPGRGALQAIAPTEIFFTYVKSALLAGFVIGVPYIFWQIWAFVAPGLYPSEKRMALPFVTASSLLFLGGISFGHVVVFPKMFAFFAAFESSFVESAWTMREVFSLTTRLYLAFGLAFQLPVVVFFLALVGLVTPRQLVGWGSYAVLLSFVMGAILTPADVVSQVFLAVPLVVLYYLGVLAAWLFVRRKKPEEEAAETS